MEIKFYKYQGTGNDFILIDDRDEFFDITRNDIISSICERKFGVGADGLILLRKHSDYDFQMLYFNSDGKQSTLCGNGSRCIVSFAKYLGLIDDKCKFLAIDGPHEAFIKDNLISIKMSNVDSVIKDNDSYIVNTGSPHFVSFVNSISDLDVKKMGAEIRYSEQFKKDGINVNFAQVSDGIKIRTYERGVENETYSCGTGAVAVALCVHKLNSFKQSPILIKTRGGELIIDFEFNNNQYINIWLRGPVELIYSGDFVCK